MSCSDYNDNQGERGGMEGGAVAELQLLDLEGEEGGEENWLLEGGAGGGPGAEEAWLRGGLVSPNSPGPPRPYHKQSLVSKLEDLARRE